MAIALDSGFPVLSQGSGTRTATITTPGTNRLLIAIGTWASQTDTTALGLSSSGVTWTLANAQMTSDGGGTQAMASVWWAWAPSVLTDHVITFTGPSSFSTQLAVYCYSGTDDVVGEDGGAQANTGTTASNAVVATAANSVIVGGGTYWEVGTTVTALTDCTETQTEYTAGGETHWGIRRTNLTSGAGSVTIGVTLGSGGHWACVAIEVLAAAGAGGTTGTAAFTMPVATAVGVGTTVAAGTAAFTMPLATVAGVGTTVATGSAALAMPLATVAAAGVVVVKGTAAFTMPLATVVATGAFGATGTAAFTMPLATVAAAGRRVATGAAAFLMPLATVAAEGSAEAGEIVPMPYLTEAATIFGTSTPGLLQDGRFRGSFDWSSAGGGWAALEIGAGPTQLLVVMSSEDGSNGDLRPEWNSDTVGNFTAWTLQVSDDSTDGDDGTWTTVETVTANKYIYRQFLIPFTGKSWLKLNATSAILVDELEVWDASDGATDTWLFLGDSITNRATKRGNQGGLGQQPSFQELIQTSKAQYPAQIGGGFVAWAAADILDRMDTLLADFPHVEHWAVSIGTNDTQLGTSHLTSFATSLRAIIEAIQADGRTALVAQIPYATDSGYGGGNNPVTVNSVQYENAIDAFNRHPTNGILAIAAEYGLETPPDLYSVFQDDTALLDDGVHPTEAGCREWNRLWSEAVDGLYRESAYAAFTMPLATVAAAGTTVAKGSASFSMPLASVAAVGTTVATGTVAFTMPAPVVVAAGRSGSIQGTAAFTTPLASVAAVGTRVAKGSAAFTMPIFAVLAASTGEVQTVASVLLDSNGAFAATVNGSLYTCELD